MHMIIDVQDIHHAEVTQHTSFTVIKLLSEDHKQSVNLYLTPDELAALVANATWSFPGQPPTAAASIR